MESLSALSCSTGRMPRAPRLIVPGLVYHLISRFVDREWFITRESERARYLSLLGRALAKTDWRCLGYAVMSNHIHIPAVAGENPLGSWIRRVNSPFANFMNREHARIGPLFVRGPRAFESPPSEVARLVAYVHNNPVRANVVQNAANSRWTSHRAYLGHDESPPWLDVSLGLRLCGFHDPQEFDKFVALHPSDPAREAVERGAIDVDPSALFREAVARRCHRGRDRPSARMVVEATALELGISPASIYSQSRSSALKLARHVAIHTASMVGVTGVAIADALDLTQSGASRALQRAGSRPEVIELSAHVTRRLGPEVIQVMPDPSLPDPSLPRMFRPEAIELSAHVT